jgi:hypothetical protein
MSQRYGRRGPRAALFSTLALLALAAPARADVQAVPGDVQTVPADAPTVATTPSGAAILAWAKGGQTCTALQAPGAPRPTRITNAVGNPFAPEATAGSCDRTPTLTHFDGDERGSFRISGQRDVVWGVAGAETARIAFKRGTTVLAQADTAPATLPGGPADLRFWAVDRARDGVEPDEIAFLDAAGVVRRAETPSGDGSPGENAIGTLLQHGQVGDTRWELRRTSSSLLAATPLQPERHVTQNCLRFVTKQVRHGALGEVTGEDGACDRSGLLGPDPMVATAASDCTLGIHVDVLATATVHRAVAVLGDGSRRTVPLVTFGDGLRAGVAMIGHGQAVRRVLALGASNRVVGSASIGAAPGRIMRGEFCGPSWRGATGQAADDDRRLGPAPHVVRSVDHGLALCTQVDRAPRIPRDCGVPPTDPELTPVLVRRTTDGRFAFGILPEDIASVRLRLSDGTMRTAPATPLTNYVGIYAGVLRQVVFDLPGNAYVEQVESLDDRGRVLSRDPPAERPDLDHPITLRPAGGGAPAVRAAPLTALGETDACIALGALETLADCDDVVFSQAGEPGYTVRVVATCTPRRLLVTAILPRRTDRLVVRTAHGREIAARIVRIPPAAGAPGYYALAVVGLREGVGAALVRGRASRRIPLDLPPAAEQCGYAASPGLLARLAPG